MAPTSRATNRDRVFDAVAVSAAAALSAFVTLGPSANLEPWTVVGLVVVSLSLARRRRAPEMVAWISVAASAVMLVAANVILRPGVEIDTVMLVPPAAPFAAYAAAAFTTRRWAAWVPVAAMLVLATAPWNPTSQRIAPGLLLVTAPALLGLYVAARQRLLRALVDRAERAEREQHLLAEQARADERVKLAAEMHDLVTHRVSAMVLQAGAMRLTARDEAARADAENLRATGCQALDDLRDLIGVLRDTTTPLDHDEPSPPPAEPMPDLTPLIAVSESVEVPVHLVTSGTPVALAPVVGRTVFRIVQEALTNVRKHAPAAHTEIHLRYQTDGVHLVVRNTAPTAAPDPALVASGAGTGLLGLRERVDFLGGTLSAGPTPDGGFQIEARLPTQPKGTS